MELQVQQKNLTKRCPQSDSVRLQCGNAPTDVSATSVTFARQHQGLSAAIHVHTPTRPTHTPGSPFQGMAVRVVCKPRQATTEEVPNTPTVHSARAELVMGLCTAELVIVCLHVSLLLGCCPAQHRLASVGDAKQETAGHFTPCLVTARLLKHHIRTRFLTKLLESVFNMRH